eukprot:Awhi_evm1s12506
MDNFQRKDGGPATAVFNSDAIKLQFESLSVNLKSKDESFTLSGSDCLSVVSSIIEFQDRHLGVHSPTPRCRPRLPHSIFFDFSGEGSLAVILKLAQNLKFDFSDDSNRESNLKVLDDIENALVKNNCLVWPTVFFETPDNSDELEKIVKDHRGNITTDVSKASHIISNEDIDALNK